jgi:phosphate transport system substrate-binding protein
MGLLVACGAGTTDIDGSSTVFPITEAMVEDWGESIGGSARLVIGVSGTGGGFKKFCAGDIDINNASRPIKTSEEQSVLKPESSSLSFRWLLMG